MAFMHQIHQLSVHPIATRSGFLDELQDFATRRKSLGKLRPDDSSVSENAKIAHFATTLAIRDCHHNCRIVDIQTYESSVIHLVRPPCMRLGAGQPDATLGRCMLWDGRLYRSDRNHQVLEP